jgi:hypothetical protein
MVYLVTYLSADEYLNLTHQHRGVGEKDASGAGKDKTRRAYSDDVIIPTLVNVLEKQ